MCGDHIKTHHFDLSYSIVSQCNGLINRRVQVQSLLGQPIILRSDRLVWFRILVGVTPRDVGSNPTHFIKVIY